jgi:hypothetical protein
VSGKLFILVALLGLTMEKYFGKNEQGGSPANFLSAKGSQHKK